MSFDLSESQEAASAFALIPAGNHVVTITKAVAGISSGGYDQIELEFENRQGDQMRDWKVLTDGSTPFVLQLLDSAGMERPGVVEPKSEEWSNYLAKLVGRKVGAIIRDEPHYDPGKRAQGQTQRRVQAYCLPEELPTEADVPPDTEGLVQTTSAKADDDIPF